MFKISICCSQALFYVNFSNSNINFCIDREGAYYNPGGIPPSKSLLGMCCWIGSRFHNWTDNNGVTFLVELLEWGRKFSGFFGIRKFW